MTQEKTVLKFTPWIPECDTPESELTLIMDVEVGEEADQAAFSLKALFEKKLEGAREYVKSNDSFRIDVVETLGYDIAKLKEIVDILEENRKTYMNLIPVKVFFNHQIDEYDADAYEELITLYASYNILSVRENDSFTQTIMAPDYTSFDELEREILELGIDIDCFSFEDD